MFTKSQSRRQRAADAAREVVERGTEGAAEVDRRARETVSDAEEVVRDSTRQVRQRSGEAYRDLADLAYNYPVATIMITFAAGALMVSRLNR
ncbi:MAG: hypothetical protein H0V62_10915 [Gammaproteobacteria bacterium]|nr:hypothetical protein [Gammaproteobacteria bacterium]